MKQVLSFCAPLLLLGASHLQSGAAPLAISAQAVVVPTITTQPASVTVKKSATATFSVTASGTSPLTYQWYKNSSAVSGATAARYTTPATTDADNYATFYVVVRNSAGSATSNAATLNVGDPPVIEQQPSSLTITEPNIATFSVYADDSPGWLPMTFQWYKNGVAIKGATDETYTATETSTADNGAVFTVVVKNSVASVTSKPATLAIQASTTSGTYPIVGNWSGTATITGTDDAGNKTVVTSPVVAAFSQNSYSITGTVVYTDDEGIPQYGVGVASLNNLNVYVVTGGGSDTVFGIAGAFTTNLLTLNTSAGAYDGTSGSGTLTLSSDKKTLTGSGKDTIGDTMTWKLTRE